MLVVFNVLFKCDRFIQMKMDYFAFSSKTEGQYRKLGGKFAALI